MSNIYERIGRAISSCGEYDIVSAETKEEKEILEGSGFKKVGSMLEGEKVISLYKIETKTIEKIVQVPIISPTITPYPPIDTTPWDNINPYKKPWASNEPYRATFTNDADYFFRDQGQTICSELSLTYKNLDSLMSELQKQVSSKTNTARNI